MLKQMSSSDTPLAARCMKPPKTPARQEDTIGLSSFITHPCSQGLLFLTGSKAGRRSWAAVHCFPLFIRAVSQACRGNRLAQSSGSTKLLCGPTSTSAGQKSLWNCPRNKAHPLFIAKPAKSCFSAFNNLSAVVARAEKVQEQQRTTPRNSTPRDAAFPHVQYQEHMSVPPGSYS